MALSHVLALEAAAPVDDFNYGSDGSLSALNAAWIDYAGMNALQSVSGQCRPQAATVNASAGAWRNDLLLGPDLAAMFTLVQKNDAGDGNIGFYFMQGANIATGAPDGYTLHCRIRPATDDFRIRRVVAGVEGSDLLVTSQEMTAADKFCATSIAGVHELWQKTGSTWTSRGSVADATYTAAKRVALIINEGNWSALPTILEDFKAMTIAAAGAAVKQAAYHYAMHRGA